MISKKNKALAAGVLAAAMSASAVVPMASSAMTSEAQSSCGSYAEMFQSMYDDVVTNGVTNKYLSSQTNGSGFGIPYHSVETFIVEAPDYGHETTSEAMSYIVWMAAMHDVLAKQGVISGSVGDLAKAWNTMEAMIPGWSKASGRDTEIEYDTIWKQERLKADTAEECDQPQDYPASQPDVEAINPMYDTFKSAYGSDNGYYLMNWLADVDDWYGFSKGSKGEGKFTFINTFQRGEQESCFETVPAPCLEELKWGNTDKKGNDGNGIKAIFNGEFKVPSQYSFTNAPDAEDRAIQAVYFANRYKAGDSKISALAGKMGDQCRNDMFDKYYKAIAKDTKITSPSAGMDSKHYLMAWYTAWGGALFADYGDYKWAWQIGCSHSHQFYQNPLAAYGLLNDSDIKSGMAASDADTDYKESLKRQIEMYQWLQSREGPFAGGCTNSWRGRYEEYPSGHATFYEMAYVPHPVYADPGSNHWIGNQVWSTQRLAELYYVVSKEGGDKTGQTYGGLKLDEALDQLLERWINWFEENTQFDYVDKDGHEFSYCIPSTLDWGKKDTDYSCTPDTWDGKYDPNGNQDLHCTIGGYGQGDVGCVSSLCNTLIYYAAAKGVDPSFANKEGTSVAEKGLYLANRLLSYQYYEGRDKIGITFTDTNPSLARVFTEEVYIPSYYKGEMPDGSELVPGATFSSIRKSYEKDSMWQEAYDYQYSSSPKYGTDVKDNNGDGKIDIKDFQFQYHRFWHAGDATVAYGTMALLFPDVTPAPEPIPGGQTTTTTTTTTSTTTTTTTTAPPSNILWGDTNCDGVVELADAILIMQSLANPNKYGLNGTDAKHLTEQGKLNGDVDTSVTGLTSNDALRIQEYLLHKISTLDPSKI